MGLSPRASGGPDAPGRGPGSAPDQGPRRGATGEPRSTRACGHDGNHEPSQAAGVGRRRGYWRWPPMIVPVESLRSRHRPGPSSRRSARETWPRALCRAPATFQGGARSRSCSSHGTAGSPDNFTGQFTPRVPCPRWATTCARSRLVDLGPRATSQASAETGWCTPSAPIARTGAGGAKGVRSSATAWAPLVVRCGPSSGGPDVAPRWSTTWSASPPPQQRVAGEPTPLLGAGGLRSPAPLADERRGSRRFMAVFNKGRRDKPGRTSS